MMRLLDIFKETFLFLSEMLHPLEGMFDLGEVFMPSYTNFE